MALMRRLAVVAIVLGMTLLVAVGIRVSTDGSVCDGRMWLPAEGSAFSWLLADHRRADGCEGPTPNNADATRAAVMLFAGMAAGLALAAHLARPRWLRLAASTGTFLMAAWVVVYAVADSPPGSIGLVAAGCALAGVDGVRRSRRTRSR